MRCEGGGEYCRRKSNDLRYGLAGGAVSGGTRKLKVVATTDTAEI